MTTSTNSYSSLYPFPFDLNEDVDQREPLQFKEQEHQAKTYVPHEGPLESESGLKLSIWKTEEIFLNHQSHYNSSDHSDLWNSSTPNFEDDQKLDPSACPDNSSNSYNNNKTSRVCADCNTTKTPLWRGGPKGPKSLCNACGIRQRKARRAMAAAAALEVNGSVVGAEPTRPPSMKTSKVQHKAKGLKNKKCKHSCQIQGEKKLCFEDLRIALSRNSAFHRVFPQDEKEAAVLLMALSYGLVHG